MEDSIVELYKLIDEKNYGKFRGFVTNNKDPEKRGRLRISIPSVLADQESDWALPCFPFGCNSKRTDKMRLRIRY